MRTACLHEKRAALLYCTPQQAVRLLTDEYFAEYADGCQRYAGRDVPQGSAVPEFRQHPVDVVLFFRGHRDDDDCC